LRCYLTSKRTPPKICASSFTVTTTLSLSYLLPSPIPSEVAYRL